MSDPVRSVKRCCTSQGASKALVRARFAETAHSSRSHVSASVRQRVLLYTCGYLHQALDSGFGAWKRPEATMQGSDLHECSDCERPLKLTALPNARKQADGTWLCSKCRSKGKPRGIKQARSDETSAGDDEGASALASAPAQLLHAELLQAETLPIHAFPSTARMEAPSGHQKWSLRPHSQPQVLSQSPFGRRSSPSALLRRWGGQ